MATLVLVRHGQTQGSWDDRDRLSPLGEAQAKALGVHWAAAGVAFDQVWTGPAKRHRRTFELAQEGGASLGEAAVLEGLDEYAPGPLVAALPALARKDPEVAAILARAQGSGSMYGVLLPLGRAWARGELEDIEPFSAFHERVTDAFATMMKEAGKGARIVAFTSAGPIGVAVAHALAAPAEKAFELTLSILNTSVSEWLFSSKGRLTLHGFNAVPHLVDPAHVTYR